MSETISLSPDTKLVSFDLWLTLIKSDGRTFKTLRNAMLQAAFAPDKDVKTFDVMVREQDKQADRIAEERGRDVMFEERVRMVAKAAEAPQPSADLLDYFYSEQTDLFKRYPPVLIDPKTPDHLARLAEEYQLAVVSNTGFIHGKEMRGALEHLEIGQYFSHLIFSNEVGYAKPDARIYNSLLDASGYQPDQVTHIGDNLRADVAGPQALGMHAIHFTDSSVLERLVATTGVEV
ncbi:MAG TPA: HAD family hydrolase [Candidatus Saccharimonadales bacterium]|nr:HAD family hydrolase [Candidatus Saccharimonadales bacterium]